MKTIEETEFYKFTKEFFKKNEKTLEDINRLRENEKPFDSVDRMYAIYIIEKKPHLLEVDLSTQEKINEAFAGGVPEEIREEFDLVSTASYNNYEREAMSPKKGYFNLLFIAKKGLEETLKDSYYEGGWFGAS